MKEVAMCDYCTFIHTKENVKIHEENCNFNPINKTCLTCKYYNNKNANGIYELNAFNCSKTNKPLCQGLRRQIVQLCDDYEEGTPNVQMPEQK